MSEQRKASHDQAWDARVKARAGINSPALHHFEGRGLEVHFQDGPIGEHGVNGTTNEIVIHVLIDRITSLNVMQGGKYRCAENEFAIDSLQMALAWLNYRTFRRVTDGTEGTSTP